MSETLRITYHNPEMVSLERIKLGEWGVFSAGETKVMGKGEYGYISVGLSIQIPEGYELWVTALDDTYRRTRLLQTNGISVFCNEDDVPWKVPVMAVTETIVCLNTPLFRFRLMPQQPRIDLVKE